MIIEYIKTLPLDGKTANYTKTHTESMQTTKRCEYNPKSMK